MLSLGGPNIKSQKPTLPPHHGKQQVPLRVWLLSRTNLRGSQPFQVGLTEDFQKRGNPRKRDLTNKKKMINMKNHYNAEPFPIKVIVIDLNDFYC